MISPTRWTHFPILSRLGSFNLLVYLTCTTTILSTFQTKSTHTHTQVSNTLSCLAHVYSNLVPIFPGLGCSQFCFATMLVIVVVANLAKLDNVQSIPQKIKCCNLPTHSKFRCLDLTSTNCRMNNAIPISEYVPNVVVVVAVVVLFKLCYLL